jgi:hypothetical protein
MFNASPGLSTKYHTYGAMLPSTSMTVGIQVHILPIDYDPATLLVVCVDRLYGGKQELRKESRPQQQKGVRIYD